MSLDVLIVHDESDDTWRVLVNDRILKERFQTRDLARDWYWHTYDPGAEL